MRSRIVRLVMLVNDVSLRNLIPAELAKGFGFVQSKPASSFSPVAVTPDELGDAWRDGRLHSAAVVRQRRVVRSPGCRRRHDVRLRPA
jgi:fumarylacetoacetate (FAA) hydrolase